MYYIVLYILFYKILSMWGKRFVWLVYKGLLFYIIFLFSILNFVIFLFIFYIIRLYVFFIEGILIDLFCGIIW